MCENQVVNYGRDVNHTLKIIDNFEKNILPVKMPILTIF